MCCMHCSRHAIDAAWMLQVAAGSMLNHHCIGLGLCNTSRGTNPAKRMSGTNSSREMHASSSSVTMHTPDCLASREEVSLRKGKFYTAVASFSKMHNQRQPVTAGHLLIMQAKQFVIKPYLINA